MEAIYGGIDAGRGMFTCLIGTKVGEVIRKQEIPTSSPEITLKQVSDFFKTNEQVQSLGIGSFWPLGTGSNSKDKDQEQIAGQDSWSRINLLDEISKEVKVPIAMDSDAACSALCEYYFGGAGSSDNFLYLSIGGGIKGALIRGGGIFHGISSPEMGHIFIPHDFIQDPFEGICPLHRDCFEGLASITAMKTRSSQNLGKVIDPTRWDLEINYISYGLANLISVLRAGLIIIGGDINRGGIEDEISRKTERIINQGIDLPKIAIAANDNAALGALMLAPLVQHKKSWFRG